MIDKQIKKQNEKNKLTIKLINLIADLWYDNQIELLIFRNSLIDKSVSEIQSIVSSAAKFVEKKIEINTCLEIANEIIKLNLPPSKIDIGKLAYEYNNNTLKNIPSFISKQLENSQKQKKISPKDVVLYGFGRIGRLLARELMSFYGNGSQLRLRAIVTRGELTPELLEKRASLLRIDSVHGKFNGLVKTDFENKALIINGVTINMISSNTPNEINYKEYNINNCIVIDNTGAWRDNKGLGKHLEAKGVSKVILTAPGKGEIPNIVHGVNHLNYDPEKVNIWSAASCTTNAISPILKVISDSFNIKKGHLETIHAYTNDQNLVDNFHKKYRRGRAAGLNMVITETGAGKAVAKAIPKLLNKLTSNAIRVPVPNGSLAILNIEIDKETSVDEINSIIKKQSIEGDLVEQIQYSISNELVSADIVGASHASVFDSMATAVGNDKKNIILYVWYDNEYGYSKQVIRLAKYVGNVRRYRYF